MTPIEGVRPLVPVEARVLGWLSNLPTRPTRGDRPGEDEPAPALPFRGEAGFCPPRRSHAMPPVVYRFPSP